MAREREFAIVFAAPAAPTGRLASNASDRFVRPRMSASESAPVLSLGRFSRRSQASSVSHRRHATMPETWRTIQ